MNQDRRQMVDRQKVLAAFGEFALQSENLDDILTRACELVAAALGTERAKILEIEVGGATLFARAGTGWDEGVIGKLRLQMNEHSSETFSIKAREPVVTQDISAETRFEVPSFMKEAGVVALVNVPIMLPRNQAYGLLQVDATEPREFGSDDVEFLRTYAIILGPVIDRIRKLTELDIAGERFQAIVSNALDYAVFLTDRQDRIVDWLPGAQSVFGWSREEVIGKPASILFTPEDRERGIDIAEVETARAAGEAPDVRWHLHKDGSRVFIDGTVKALRTPGGELTGFIKIGQDVTAARLAQERQRVLIDGVPQLVWRAEGEGQWKWSSPQWTQYTGQPAADSQALGWLEKVHPDDRTETMAAWASAPELGRLEVEHRIHHRGEERYRWFQTRAAPVRDGEDGTIKEWLGTSTDVDDLRRMQDQQHVMVAELQHRTRNLIAVVQSIARQTGRGVGSVAEFQARFEDRLAALSRVQGLLSRAEARPIEISTLVEMEFEALGIEACDRVAAGGPSIVLPNGVVQTLALALHELATNARKYGALTVDDGRLDVRWDIQSEAAGAPRLMLEWREENIDPLREAASPATSGYGRELIERALPYSLDAKTSYELSERALHCTINMPLKSRGPS